MMRDMSCCAILCFLLAACGGRSFDEHRQAVIIDASDYPTLQAALDAAAGDCSLAPADDQSLTRSPDIGGDFVPHTSAAGAAGAFSPGTRVDGTAF